MEEEGGREKRKSMMGRNMEGFKGGKGLEERGRGVANDKSRNGWRKRGGR